MIVFFFFLEFRIRFLKDRLVRANAADAAAKFYETGTRSESSEEAVHVLSL